MKNTILSCTFVFCLLTAGCKKDIHTENLSTAPPTSGFVKYTIPKGAHFSTGNVYKTVDLSELKFVVRFDSSCIYTSSDPANQHDINKLYGFADNGAMHQQFSARIGWRWSEGALHLFAYTYNGGERSDLPLGTVPVGSDVACGIRIEGHRYIFSVGEKEVAAPRQSKTSTAKGYQLYPYFGGDEPAPHEISIWIKEE
jgi:hypothetical protein